jgi:hypothetical protein
MSLYVAFVNGIFKYKNYIKWWFIFISLYFLLSYISVLYSSEYASKKYLFDIFPYIVMASLIPLGFYDLRQYNKNYMRWSFVIILFLMLLGMYMMNNHYIDINKYTWTILDEQMKRTNWTQKNYMFWYVLFMWGTVSLFNIKKLWEAILIFIILGSSYFVLKNGYSQSAMLAFLTGSVVYVLLSILKISKKLLYILVGVFTAYIIFSPLFFSLVDLTSMHPKFILRMKRRCLKKNSMKKNIFKLNSLKN